jgi:hypothetical protein
MTPAERRARKNAKDRERRAAIKAGTWPFPMNGDAAKANGGNYARRARRKAETHSGSPAVESSAPPKIRPAVRPKALHGPPSPNRAKLRQLSTIRRPKPKRFPAAFAALSRQPSRSLALR